MIEISPADLKIPTHGQAVVQLMDEYARDPMGGGTGLSEYTKANLIAELIQRPAVHPLLAWQADRAVGLIVCIEGFSTFACRPLLNIHDVIVSHEHRGQGISKLLLKKAEELAIAQGCCKITLEVLTGNTIAQAAYKSAGFGGYELDPAMGQALFWEKKLP
jgi:ribosomal protein S18 acetylase RimI-like enzyme